MKEERIIISKISSCRVCRSTDIQFVHDFGTVPLADKLADHSDQHVPEASLSISFCTTCYHLQINEDVDPAILFRDNYPYYSSRIPELREHFKKYAQSISEKYRIDSKDLVIEIASNDGLLLGILKTFTSNVLGIDPSRGPANEANQNGIPTREIFFDKHSAESLLKEQLKPRLIIANNVLAHVPNPRDFVAAIAMLAKEDTMVIVEVPHLLPMIQNGTFDVIFHQHYSYFSLHSLIHLWKSADLYIHEVDRSATQGGSLRLHISKKVPEKYPDTVRSILIEEENNRLFDFSTYQSFSDNISTLKENVQLLLVQLNEGGKKVVGYGAPGKAATLLNYFKIDPNTVAYLVDISSTKHYKYFPNANIPIYPVNRLEEDAPDYILILAWNYADSIIRSLHYLKDKGTKFIILYPSLSII